MGRKGGRENRNKSQRTSVPNSHHFELSPHKEAELGENNKKLLKVTTFDFKVNAELYEKIFKLLQKTISIEKEIDVGFAERDDKAVQELTEWALKNGAHIEGVAVEKVADYGYGICAKRDFEEGEFITSVPKKLMMTIESARNSELEYLMKTDPLLARMPNVSLSLFVLLEKFRGDSSFWAPYLNCLPSSYSTVMYFNSSEIAALKGSPVYEPAIKQCQNISRQYVYLRNLMHGSSDAASEILKKHFTYEQYRWAVSTVMTRLNFIPTNLDEQPMMLALIPWWDMGNHDNGQLTTDYNVEEDRSEYRTCRPFTNGQQVFMSYGQRPNRELFLHNGFVHTENQSDGIKIRLGISKSDPLVKLKSSLLQELAIPSSAEFLISVERPFRPHGKFFAFLRIFNMDQGSTIPPTRNKFINGMCDPDFCSLVIMKRSLGVVITNDALEMFQTHTTGLEEWSGSENKDDLMLPDLTLPIDAKVWQFLRDRINLLLVVYSSKLQDDENILSKPNLSPCMKLAVLQRMTEKRILNNALEDLKNLENSNSSISTSPVKQLDGMEPHKEQKAMEEYLSHIENYC